MIIIEDLSEDESINLEHKADNGVDITNESTVVETTDYVINCYYTNAQSISNKKSEFMQTEDMWKPKLIGITESGTKVKTDAESI